MNTLEKLNEYAHLMDGDITEFTPWHLSAFKAAIAITNCAPCDDEMLLRTLDDCLHPFGSLENQVEYGGTVIDKSNDDLLMLVQQYELITRYSKLSNRWSIGYTWASQGINKFTHSNECKHTAIAECIAALPDYLLEI